MQYSGSCLCGYISYKAIGSPTFPHLCSCSMCQKWSGAFTVGWVEFSLKGFSWSGEGELSFYQSSEKTKRGFCPKCGSSLCAIDEGYENISITLASLHQHKLIKPDAQHSFSEEAPIWWRVEVRDGLK